MANTDLTRTTRTDPTGYYFYGIKDAVTDGKFTYASLATNGLSTGTTGFKLGGTLIENTTIAKGGFNLGIDGTGTFVATAASGGDSTILSLLGTSFNLYYDDAVNLQKIEADGTDFKITDTINTKGLVYAADYSANFTARSLVDKDYVDSNNVIKTLVTKQADYTATSIDEVILSDGSLATVTITLPTISATNHGQVYTLKAIDVSSLCDIDTDGADTFEDTTTNYAFTNAFEIFKIIADNNSATWRQL